ncbi:retrovirus-related pol polyprotein from transposon TNT 1-94 [Tanacetum coccineum]
MMSTSTHQQSLADVGSKTRPPMLERGTIDSAAGRSQNEDDLMSDDLKRYEADIEAMNLILISIPKDIYNSVDACENARYMWHRVKRLMQGTELSETERESRFVNEFDKFTTETRESLSSPEWYKYVKNVRLAKNLKTDTFANTYASSSSSRSPTAYYVTHPLSVVNYDDDYLGDVVCDDQGDSLTTAMMLLAPDRVDIQNRNVGNGGRYAKRNASNVQCYNCNAKGHYARECPKLRNDFLLADASEIKELKELSANICMMARIQKSIIDYEDGLSYDFAFISEQQEIIKPTIGNDQINSDIIFDDPNVEFNDGKVELDKNAHDQQDNEMELLDRNAYK